MFLKLGMSARDLEIEGGRFGKIDYQDLTGIVNTGFCLEYKLLELEFTSSSCAQIASIYPSVNKPTQCLG